MQTKVILNASSHRVCDLNTSCTQPFTAMDIYDIPTYFLSYFRLHSFLLQNLHIRDFLTKDSIKFDGYSGV